MLLFAFVLLIAGGAIAYMGDRLGTYIGKKRLSVLGLRPRHTAMLYTVVFGGLISVGTLFALIGYDHSIQLALLRGPQLLEENHSLSVQNRQQRLLILSREKQAQAADTKAQQAEASATSATLRARTALRQALNAELRLRHSLDRLRVAQNTLARSQSDLQLRQSQLAVARRRLVVVDTSLGSTRADLHAARARVRAAQGQVREANADLRRARLQYGVALGKIDDLSEQGKQLSHRNGDLSAENSALDAKNLQLLTQTNFLQGAHLIYHRGQELGRRVFPTGEAADTIRQDLVSFLSDLGHEAQTAGATLGENGRAVRIVADSGPGKTATEDEALDSLTQSIVQQAGIIPGVVVVAAAHYNTFDGEPVQIEVQPYDNVLVFSKGALISSTVVDGSLSEYQILDALQAFLKEQVQPAARRQGVIPRPDPKTGEPTVGEPTDQAETQALVRQIQRIGPGALVIARAAADTYSSGPLRLALTADAPDLAKPTTPDIGRPIVPPVPPAHH